MRPHRRETWDKGRVYTCYKSFLENQEAKKKKKKERKINESSAESQT
jgi:hypothetical protein